MNVLNNKWDSNTVISVRDLWLHQDLDTIQATFKAPVCSHCVNFTRMSAN